MTPSTFLRHSVEISHSNIAAGGHNPNAVDVGGPSNSARVAPRTTQSDLRLKWSNFCYIAYGTTC